MNYPHELIEGTFLARRKRFLADCVLPDGTQIVAHLANTGSMKNCMEPGCRARLSLSDNPKRKLPYSVEQLEVGGHWIVVNTARPNAVIEEALRDGALGAIDEGTLKREAKHPGGSRFDFFFRQAGRPVWAEVKSVTLLEGERLRFPDAVTERGKRHVEHLTSIAAGGDRAALMFFVGRGGGEWVEPAHEVDPSYSTAVWNALQGGVEISAWRCQITRSALSITGQVPFRPHAPEPPVAP